MALDEAGLSPEPHQSTGPCNNAQAVEDISNHFTTTLPKALRNHEQLGPFTPPRTHVRKRSSLKEILLGSPASPRRRTPVKGVPVTDGRTRRLGVSFALLFHIVAPC